MRGIRGNDALSRIEATPFAPYHCFPSFDMILDEISMLGSIQGIVHFVSARRCIRKDKRC